MTFRTPAEAVELANNTTYGLAACVWSENINVALDVAAQIKAGVVWVNATNLFDAACGFGGYRESGYGREGGKEGMYEYLEPRWLQDELKAAPVASLPEPKATPATGSEVVEVALEAPLYVRDSDMVDDEPNILHSVVGGEAGPQVPFSSANVFGIDRTVKQYIGGKQARPDSGYSYPVYGSNGKVVGEAPVGSRKDIRNAVEAARNVAPKWAKTAAHGRAQILYFMAENLVQRKAEIVSKLADFVGPEQAAIELDYGVERIFSYAAWCDKFEGSVHNPPMRMVTLAMKEAIGTVGILCPDDAPLLGFLSLVLPAIAMGNTVIAVPSERCATLMGELYQVLDTSDLPGGVVNIVAGKAAELGKTHDDLDAIWSFRDEATSTMVKAASIGNLKQVWTNEGRQVDWFDPAQAEGRFFLRHATQIKNIWVPYGE
jgi:aldehyde dehydrogenase (NAD+)